MAQVAGLTICAGFAAVIVPNTAADQRKHQQKRRQHRCDLDSPNCPVLLHIQQLKDPACPSIIAARATRISSVLQTRGRRKRLQRKR